MKIDNSALLAEYMSAPQNNPDSDEYFTLLSSQLKERKNNNKMVAALLAKYVHSVSMGIGESAKSYMLSDEYSQLSNDNKASIIREIMAPGVILGYHLLSETTEHVIRKQLKVKSDIKLAKPIFDDKRMNAVLKKGIGKSFAGDQEVASSFLQGSFQNISATGSRDTFTTNYEELKKHKVGGKRMTTSPHPCDVCSAMNGSYLVRDAGGSYEVEKFHDHCSCTFYLLDEEKI